MTNGTIEWTGRFDDALHTIWFGTLDTRPSSDPATHAIAAKALAGMGYGQ